MVYPSVAIPPEAEPGGGDAAMLDDDEPELAQSLDVPGSNRLHDGLADVVAHVQDQRAAWSQDPGNLRPRRLVHGTVPTAPLHRPGVVWM